MVQGKTPIHSDAALESTRERLLDAAEELFADRGFSGTIVRDLTSRASSNIAAVNYYFSSKEKLYEEMFRRLLADLRKRRLEAINGVVNGGDATLENLLRTYADVFLEPLADLERGKRLLHLFMREMISPRLPEGMFFREMIQPVQDALVRAMQMSTPGLTREDGILCLHSFVAQLMHVIHMTSYSFCMDSNSTLPDMQSVVDHFVSFTIGGILARARENATL